MAEVVRNGRTMGAHTAAFIKLSTAIPKEVGSQLNNQRGLRADQTQT